MKEKIIVLVLIFLAVFAIESRYIHGKLITPKDTVYLGTVHFSSDYFYYLSQMAQGRWNFLRSTKLFTPEKLIPVYVGWQHVLTGRIFTSLGFGIIETYQIAVGIYLSLFLLAGYAILKLVYPKDFKKRLLAFIFFITATSLWKIEMKGGGWDLGYYWYWYNLGNFFTRFGPTPHHLLANIFQAAAIILVLIYHLKANRNLMVLLSLSLTAILLTSITPVSWGVLTITFGFFSLACFLIKKARGVELGNYFFPVFFFVLPAIPVVFYIKHVYSMIPYNLGIIWESGQQVNLDLIWLVKGSGLIIILALIGFFPVFKKKNLAAIFGTIFILVSGFFHLSPIPSYLQLTNMRFWSSALYIFLGALAVEGSILLISKSGKFRKILTGVLAGVYLISIVPTYYIDFREILKPNLGNAYYYIPQAVYDGYIFALNKTKPVSLFLVEWPFNESFPAITGRKSFFGYYLETIDSYKKTDEAFSFFSGKMKKEDAWKLLSRYKINYVLGYSWHEHLKSYEFLKAVYENPTITVYEVNI